ncbi:hypothetical protein [Bdellovibrio sp. HCB274]|uniref:hypothetical protein n=1 Tax=Bdellovibrio sp. HCB274 TaxID=3394361 RepID=UPI0039B49A74
MQLEYILNELSIRELFPTPGDAHAIMDVFIDVVMASRSSGVKPNVRTHVKINQIELSSGYYISNWAADQSINREKRLYIHTLLTKNPLLKELPDPLCEDIKETSVKVYRTHGDGVTVSYLTDNPVISFNTDPKWDVPLLDIEVEQLKTGDQGNPEIVQHTSTLINFSTLQSFQANRTKIQQIHLRRFATIEDFWARKGDVYPHLTFSPEVKDQLAGYTTPQQQFFQQAMMRLNEINNYCQTWSSGPCTILSDIPNISPESLSTMQAYGELRKFPDDSGSYKLCELHARITPGPGRIHFYPLPDQKKIFIGYIGPKLKCS